MRLRPYLLLLVTALCIPSISSAQWFQEPAGSLVLECAFNSKPTPSRDAAGCGIENFYNAGAIVSDASAPLSPSNVYKSWISAGQSGGGTQLNYVTPQTYREMWVGIKWRTNPEFFGRQVANKLFFIRGPVSNGVFMMMGGPGGGNDAGKPSYIVFAHNSGNINNGHACGGDAAGATCFPNVGSGQVVPAGTWFTLEAYVKSSTTNTSRDGIVRWWVNGQPAGNYTNLNVSSLGLNEWVWSETWDGTVNPPPAQEWAHFIDHVKIVAANGGGGPPSDTTPPGQVTNVTVTQLN